MQSNQTLLVNNAGGNRCAQLLKRVDEKVGKKCNYSLINDPSGIMMKMVPDVWNAVTETFINEAKAYSRDERDKASIGLQLDQIFKNALGYGRASYLEGTSSIDISSTGTLALMTMRWPESSHRYMMPSYVRDSASFDVRYIKPTIKFSDGTVAELPLSSAYAPRMTSMRPQLGSSAWKQTEAYALDPSTVPTDNTNWIAANTVNESEGRRHPNNPTAFHLLANDWNAVTVAGNDGVDVDTRIVAVQYLERTGASTYTLRTKKVDIHLMDKDNGVGKVTWTNSHDSSVTTDMVFAMINRENGELSISTSRGLLPTATDAVGVIKVLVEAYKTTEYGNTVSTIFHSTETEVIKIPQGDLVQASFTQDQRLDFSAMTGLELDSVAVDTLGGYFTDKQNVETWQYIQKVHNDFISTIQAIGQNRNDFVKTWNANSGSSTDNDIFVHRKSFTIQLKAIIRNLATYTRFSSYSVIVACGNQEFDLFSDFENFEVTPGGAAEVIDCFNDTEVVLGVAKIGNLPNIQVVSSRSFRNGAMYIYLVPKGSNDMRGIEHFAYDYSMSRAYRSPENVNLNDVLTARRRELRKSFLGAVGKLVVLNNSGDYPGSPIAE